MNGRNSAGLRDWTPSQQATGGVLGGGKIDGGGRRIPWGGFHCGPINPHHFQCGGGRGGVSLADSGMWETNHISGPGRGNWPKGYNLLCRLWMVVG